ncbi:radical SAM family heme chaperone HemW [Celerinatantimonas yamalensis]|uniref:Heme chaperone HemW n=1 Tax=Celerinatantimonas yamalensis TaxID=559956 RepID=A0ABW9G8T7_9GAMM
MLALPKLSLYIHIPWCVQKCPYCDFNSHAQKSDIPEQAYISALLADLDDELALVQGRALHSIFIGGGTPSLLSAQAIARLLDGVSARFICERDMEVTMEANPGTAEAARFAGYFAAGVNRLSLGIQSFDDAQLTRLGRIHDSRQAIAAAEMARQAGFERLNLDLMHGLPYQNAQQAQADLAQAIALEPTHISWYQLTIEANTAFASKPPPLPDEDRLWDIETAGKARLADHGYQQYEVSAYGLGDDRARHNLNYWRFGDYIGIGCGAHGKLTDLTQNSLKRRVKVKHPKGYLEKDRNKLDQSWEIATSERPFEYFLNRLRLYEAIPKAEFRALTDQPLSLVEPAIQRAQQLGLMSNTTDHWQVSAHGRLFLNDLLDLFLVE